jgi:DNA modification methylase
VATPKGPDFNKNLLFYGDNLDVLRQWVKDDTVDLIYLDPPFNSNRTYNVLFKHQTTATTNAQIQAFDDTWTWSQDDEVTLAQLLATAPPKVADAIGAMRQLIGPSDMLSYLVMMTVRLIELHRVLKPTGSLYLHCDPVASHYLKVMLDAIFGAENFRNEITWQRTHSHGNVGRNFGSVSDILLFYAGDGYTWNQPYVPMADEYVKKRFSSKDPDGRRWQSVTLRNPSPRPNLHYPYEASNGVTYHPHPNGWSCDINRMKRYDDEGRLHFPAKVGGQLRLKQYLDDTPGVKASNIWSDIYPINSQAAERLGYPTQKPLALLERIIQASSNPGDLVMDPFCGCGTAVDAAERLGRRWIGMDISYLSIDLVETRLLHTYGADVSDRMEIVGVPRDEEGAQALFRRSPFDFERWAVSLIDGTPNEKQVGDRGVDGVVRFPVSAANDIGRLIVSVKGGNLNPSMVRDLAGTIEAQNAAMGVLITNQPATKGMVEAAQHSGSYEHPLTGARYPKVQIVSVRELLAGQRPKMPTPFLPYLQAPKFVPHHPTLPGME